MKIAVLLKQVPDTETKIKVKADGSGIEEADIKWVINPYDEYAVESALRLKEKLGAGEVVVVSVGPKRVVEAMRQAMAMGADRGIRVDTEGIAIDNYLTAVALAKVVATENFNIVLAGKQAVDDDQVMVAHGVAESLGWPCLWPVEQLELGADSKTVLATRSIAGGVKQVLEAELPCIICCDKSENAPRYASLPGIMKAKSRPVQELKCADLVAGESAAIVVQDFTPPPERQPGKMLKGEPEAMCAELVRLLREEAKVI